MPFVFISIAKELQFEYYVAEPRDGVYGINKGNGTWSGMLGELMRGVSERERERERGGGSRGKVTL